MDLRWKSLLGRHLNVSSPPPGTLSASISSCYQPVFIHILHVKERTLTPRSVRARSATLALSENDYKRYRAVWRSNKVSFLSQVKMERSVEILPRQHKSYRNLKSQIYTKTCPINTANEKILLLDLFSSFNFIVAATAPFTFLFHKIPFSLTTVYSPLRWFNV